MRDLADEGKPLDLATALGATPDLLKRLLAIRGKAKENEEERGIQTMFVALGMAGWKATDGGRDPKAPMFLLPVTVTDTPRAMDVAWVRSIRDRCLAAGVPFFFKQWHKRGSGRLLDEQTWDGFPAAYVPESPHGNSRIPRP